jgi:flagellar FliJ protein
MRKFVFNMQKILDLREFEKKQAEAELGKAVAEETKIKDTLELIARQRVQQVSEAGKISGVNELYGLSNYFALLDQRKEQLLKDLVQAQMVKEQKREVFKQAMLKVKALEKLKESRLSEWKTEQMRKEAAEIDDINNSKIYRE